jgi:D-alanine-D-alanine ligase
VRIGLTYNLKPADVAGDQFEEFDSLETVEALEGALRARGHTTLRLGWGEEMLSILDRERVDGVFNFAEGVGGRGRESQVPAMLEMLGIPYTASEPLTIAMTLDKPLAKLMAKAHGIATAPWWVTPDVGRALARPDGLKPVLHFPVFAKPAAEGSSMGITAASVCDSEEQLDAALDRLKAYGPVLVEEFLSGDEFTVGLIDGEVVGVMQVVPRRKDEAFIYSLEVKRDYMNRVDYRLADAPDVAEVGRAVWRAFGLKDVARVDVRRDRDGVANFVEVNPLPGMNPVTGDLVICARLAGMPYEELIGRVVDSAVRRWTAAVPAGGSAASRRRERDAPGPAGEDAGGPNSKIAVCYNDDWHYKKNLNEIELTAEESVADMAREVAEPLGAALVAVRDDVVGALRELKQYDVVFDLCEGVLGHSNWEMNFALGLEMFGIANANVEPIAIGLCTDKLLVKRLLRAAGLPSPRLWHGENDGTWIVKPSREDAGIGIDAASVVTGADAVEARVRYVQETYKQPALVEEFIEGHEFNQAVYFTVDGPVLLPPGEIVFDESLSATERVVGWKAKWATDSREDRATRPQVPAVISDTLRRDIGNLALSAASVLSLSGYCRFDMRQSPDGRLWIVDINPNPDISAGAGFRRALDAAGIPFPEFLNALMMAALARRRRP